MKPRTNAFSMLLMLRKCAQRLRLSIFKGDLRSISMDFLKFLKNESNQKSLKGAKLRVNFQMST
jgi:hypothetical protein